MRRFKIMTAVFAFCLMTSVITNHVTAELAGYSGKYVWQGQEFNKFKRIEFETGYIDEYTAKSGGFCHR